MGLNANGVERDGLEWLDALAVPDTICRVPIDSLVLEGSPRLNGEDASHIQVLAGSGASLPPILVHHPTMRVLDGMHRLRAAQAAGKRTIDVRFFDGSDDEAFLIAVRANIAHGLPLTLADRQAAAARIIQSHPHYSDRWIAEIAGLAPATVAAIRGRASADAGTAGARIGRDGRVRPVSSADGRRRASAVLAENPGASLREIARIAGISPATVRDVRERVRRGDDPVPARQPARMTATTTCGGDYQRPRPERMATVETDRNLLFQELRNDPSLRYSESGRTLLHWLSSVASGPGQWREMVSLAPPHTLYFIVRLARLCVESWLEVTRELERRLPNA